MKYFPAMCSEKAILLGLLAPQARLLEAENAGNTTARLALFEDWRSLPWGAVWDEYCLHHNRPVDGRWIETV